MVNIVAKERNNSCSECSQLNCYRHDKKYPDYCLTEKADSLDINETRDIYNGDSIDAIIARASADVEGTYYGQLTRVEEIVAFARRIGAKKIGIATCLGLIDETRIFTKILHLAGFETYAALCKVGSIDKTEIGIPDEKKIAPGNYEAACNPILQARLLNEKETQLNVVVGLCVGHDSLFIKYSDAPVTTLITKDRVTGHNPAVALYTSRSYSKRILDSERLKNL